MNATLSSYGPAFGLGVLIPVTLLLIVPLVMAIRNTASVPGKFVIIALWLRYIAGAYHIYMFKRLGAGLSGNALLSIGVTAIGLAFIVRPANLAIRQLLPIYLIIAVAMVSAVLNHDPAGGINTAVKYAYLIVIAVAVFQALRLDPEGRFIGWALVAFLPLLVFQALSVVLHLPKGSETGDGLVWIGGYNHEGAFSVALVAGFTVGCFARSVRPAIRIAFLFVTLIGIQLAGYRTSILALAPLAAATFFMGMTVSVRREQRAFMATSALVGGTVVLSLAAILYADKFADLVTFLSHPGQLIKPPREFDYADRQVMSARPLIWSSYLYAWKEGGAVQTLVGFGPESWEGLFKVYPHNTLVGTLYELGLFGVAAMVLLWIVMAAAAFRAAGERIKLVAAHFAFFLLNMATMPFWQVEGLGLYGFLCGYTIFQARAAAARPRWRRPLPMAHPTEMGASLAR